MLEAQLNYNCQEREDSVISSSCATFSAKSNAELNLIAKLKNNNLEHE